MQLTIHWMPKRSVRLPNWAPQNMSCKGVPMELGAPP